jgi:ABC-type sugar transport system permease subunit/ABC-type glycerol-3-phosphate transport system substrate-binding protein
MNVTRSITATVALLFLCLALADRASTVASTRLVVWGMESGADSQAQDAEIASFEQMNPSIDVITLSMGAGGMNPQKLMTAIVGGVPPDVVQQDRFTIGDWASRDAFLPLDGFLARDNASSNTLAVKRENFVPAAWAETIFRGHVYAVPDGIDDRVLYYNRSLFRAAGLDPNQSPRTWDELIYDAKALTKRNTDGSYDRIGFIPLYSQGWLYLWSWQEDGDVMSPDGRTCTIDNPQTAQALTAIVSWYDQLGGIDAVSSFANGFGSEEQDPFLNGTLAMRVDNDGLLTSIARYNPNLDFGVCPVPVPTDRFHHRGRFKNDSTWVTWSGGFSLAIPQGAKHTKEAWQFIQWMSSPDAALIGARARAAYCRERGRQFVPALYANTKANSLVTRAFAGSVPPKLSQAKDVMISLLPYTRFRPVTFVGQRLWDEQVRAVDRAVRHNMTPTQALAEAQSSVQTELDAAYNRDSLPLFPVKPALYTAAILLLLAVAYGASRARRWMALSRRADIKEAKAALLFISPWVFGFMIFTFGPILASLVLSFCDYNVLHPARWAGVSNYLSLVTTDRPIVLKSLGNVAYLAAIGIPLNMVTGLSMAMLLNTKAKGMRFFRTAFYVPSLVPVVASTVLWGWILNSDPHRGLVNAIWMATLTNWFHIAPPGWEAVPAWSKPGLILMGLWGAGGGMILWLAGLQSIPATLYEAASVDGAGGWSKFVHITLPMLSPIIFFSLIMGVIGSIQTFETTYILGNTGGGSSTGPDDSLLVPVVYLFNNAFQYFKMGYASALAWLLFILILGLTLAQIKLAPRWVHYESQDR